MTEQVKYSLKIEDPHQHQVKVGITVKWPKGQNHVDFFMPSWSPGSYLMREYGRFVRQISVVDENGEFYHFEQKDKGTWSISRNEKGFSNGSTIHISYLVYCHELTVRTSHVDRNHAFIHGPSVFMGVKGFEKLPIELDLKFPNIWSKVSTGLNDISPERGVFKFESLNYDDFIDCPIEIGNHDTDGFKADGKNHELAFFGGLLPHNQQIKSVMTEQYNNLQNTLMETNMKIQELQQHVNDVVKKNRGPILQNWKT